jgi:hypothetical protein
MLRRRAHVPLLAALLMAGACDPSLAPIEVGPGCPQQPLRGPEQFALAAPTDRLIDDFESGDNSLPRIGGRTGTWIVGYDLSELPKAEILSTCVARGSFAGHFTGAGFTSWGANWTAVLKSGAAVPFDATAYSAISFWAAVGGNAVAPDKIPMGVTTTEVAWNGGMCTMCMDFFRTTVTLSRSWQRVVIPLSSLAQAGWGVPQVSLRRDQLVGFIMWPDHQFDIWIDDVRFEL